MNNWKRMIYNGVDYGDLYLITEDGEVMGVKTGIIRSKSINHEGYYFITISNGKRNKKTIKIHRAVAENFVEGKSDGLIVNHIDGNKLNNNYKNLEWCTTLDNNHHAVKIGLWKWSPETACKRAKLTHNQVAEIRQLLNNKKMKQKDIANLYNVLETTISGIARNRIYCFYT
jgi:hypothetical protein